MCLKEFSRCILCNTELGEIEKEFVLDRLPPKVKKAYDQFFFCSKCDKIYWAGSHVDEMDSYIKELKEKYDEAMPLGRIGKPEDITKLAVLLASEDSNYITGQAYTISGGFELVQPDIITIK